jgi:hypothetical protein
MVLFAKALAVGDRMYSSLIDLDDTVKPRLIPMLIYTSLDRFDTDHELEIADSGSEPLHDRFSAE